MLGKKRIGVTATAILTTLVSATAYAETAKQATSVKSTVAPRAEWELRFRNADLDHSGGLSQAELKKADPARFPIIRQNFQKMDANKDNEVSIKERDAFEQRNAKK